MGTAIQVAMMNIVIVKIMVNTNIHAAIGIIMILKIPSGPHYISTDTYEKDKRNWGNLQPYEQTKSVNIRSHSSSSDSAAESSSSKKSRKRQSRNQRNQNQANQKVVTEMQDQFGAQSEMMSQNNKNIEKIQQ